MYNNVFVRWTTHQPKGLSVQDIDMAVVCDAIARDFGEIAAKADADDDARQLRDLTSTLTSSAGDCCVPKGKGSPDLVEAKSG